MFFANNKTTRLFRDHADKRTLFLIHECLSRISIWKLIVMNIRQSASQSHAKYRYSVYVRYELRVTTYVINGYFLAGTVIAAFSIALCMRRNTDHSYRFTVNGGPPHCWQKYQTCRTFKVRRELFYNSRWQCCASDWIVQHGCRQEKRIFCLDGSCHLSIPQCRWLHCLCGIIFGFVSIFNWTWKNFCDTNTCLGTSTLVTITLT